MIAAFRRSSTTMIVLGVIAIVFGLIASIWPLETALAFVTVWGIYAIVDGLISFGMAFSSAGRPARGWLLLSGVVGVIAGLIAVFRPFSGAVALAWVLGIWLLVRGVLELVSAFAESQPQPRWTVALSGILWLIAGVLVVANPGIAALTVSVWIGILAIVWGVLLIIAAILFKNRLRDAERTAV